MDETRLSRLGKKYNREHSKLFKNRASARNFLSPLGLSISKSPPSRFGDNLVKLKAQEEVQIFQALHFIKYKLGVALNRQRNMLSRYVEIYKAIRNRAVSANIGLLYKCISITTIQMDDENLLDAGQLGLIDAADNFDPWRGTRFSTYAMNCIIRRFVRESRMASRMHVYNDIDLAEALVSEQEDTHLNYLKERVRMMIEERANGLTEQDVEILTLRFCLDDPASKRLTLRAISEIQDLSKERIRQLQDLALKKLREAFEEQQILV